MERAELQREVTELFDKLGFRRAATPAQVKDMLLYQREEVCNSPFWEEEDTTWGWNCGAYRIAIWNEDSDYVFKFSYRGDEDCCDIERKNYLLAEFDNVEQCFAKMIYVGQYNLFVKPIYVYAMEKAYVDEDENRERSSEASFQRFCEENGYDYEEAYYDSEIHAQYEYDCSWYLDETDQMLDLAHCEWDEELYNRFMEFVDENNISDLHAGNWGRINGRLVVIDYAGIV